MGATHRNAFIQEVDAAYHKVLGAIDEFKQKVEALKTKYETEINELAPQVKADVHTDVHTAEEQVKEAEQTASQDDTADKKKAA